MSGDNSKDKREEMSHPGDEDSESSVTKQGEKKSIKNELKSEEPEILEKKPEKMIESSIEAFMGRISGPFSSLLESKINEKHIDKILDIKEKYDDNVFRDTQSSKKFHLIYTVIGVSLFLFLTLFLVGKYSNLLEDIIKFIIGLGGGIGIGYGFKSYKDRD